MGKAITYGTYDLLPMLQLLGGECLGMSCAVRRFDKNKGHDGFVKADFVCPNAAVSAKAVKAGRRAFAIDAAASAAICRFMEDFRGGKDLIEI